MVTRFLASLSLSLVLALPLGAQTGSVLIIANQDYDRIRDARGAQGVLDTGRRFERMGFHVDQATDVSTLAMRAALTQLSDDLAAGRSERVVIVLSGYTVSNGSDAWFLGTQVSQPRVFSLDQDGIRLDAVLSIAGQVQGGAVVALADFGFPQALGGGISGGLPLQFTVPQGVSVVRGSLAGISAFLQGLAEPGARVGALVAQRQDLRLEGFDPPFLHFVPQGMAPSRDADRDAWLAAQQLASVEGYDAYLADWPNGEYAALARSERDRLWNTPERIEEAMRLSRDERRAVQRDLTILGFDTRGVDGVFGRGTRSAISAWQGANRFQSTGYLNREQVIELGRQGTERARQLDEEARARQAEAERRERIYWRDTGSGQDEAGMRAYLQRYPQGIFAAVAVQRLQEIDAQRRAEEERRARRQESNMWEDAQRIDTEEAYRAYLQAYPRGEYARQARQRIEELRRREPEVIVEEGNGGGGGDNGELPPLPQGADLARALTIEQSLNLPVVSIQLVEGRLAQLGLNPGPADGVLDEASRRAIQRYQLGTGLPATGYLDAVTVAQMLGGQFIDLLR